MSGQDVILDTAGAIVFVGIVVLVRKTFKRQRAF